MLQYVNDNLAVMSVGFLLKGPEDAVIWRGPRKNGQLDLLACLGKIMLLLERQREGLRGVGGGVRECTCPHPHMHTWGGGGVKMSSCLCICARWNTLCTKSLKKMSVFQVWLYAGFIKLSVCLTTHVLLSVLQVWLYAGFIKLSAFQVWSNSFYVMLTGESWISWSSTRHQERRMSTCLLSSTWAKPT